ncbi:hypothetical protein [Microbacterium sp. NPDC055455]
MGERWLFGRRLREAAKAWRTYREVAQLSDERPPVLFEAGFSMGVAAAQEALVRKSLEIEADFLDDIGEHDEAKAVRARIPLCAEELEAGK